MIFNDVASSLLAPGGVLDTGPSLARWNQRKAQVAPLVPADAARWGHDAPTTPFGTVFTATYGVANWQAETNWVETQFFPARTQLMRDQLRAFLIGRSSGIADGPTYGDRRCGSTILIRRRPGSRPPTGTARAAAPGPRRHAR